MMLKAILLTSVLFVSACKKKEESKPAEPSKSAEPGAAPAGSAAAPAAPAAAASLDCDKVLPKELRDKYFAKHEIKPEKGVFDYVGKCKIEPGTSGDTYGGEVSATCHQNQTMNRDQMVTEMQKRSPEWKPIEGIPQSLMSTSEIGNHAFAYDQESNCKIDVVLPKSVDAAAFIKDWLAYLPPK